LDDLSIFLSRETLCDFSGSSMMSQFPPSFANFNCRIHGDRKFFIAVAGERSLENENIFEIPL